MTLNDNAVGEVQGIADRLDWNLKLISISTKRTAADFLHLAVHHRCLTKDQIELGYIALYACEAIEEMEIWLSFVRSQPTWLAAKRIAMHYRKTIFNPYETLSGPIVIDNARLMLMLKQAVEKTPIAAT